MTDDTAPPVSAADALTAVRDRFELAYYEAREIIEAAPVDLQRLARAFLYHGDKALGVETDSVTLCDLVLAFRAAEVAAVPA